MSVFTNIREKLREWKRHPAGKVLLNRYFVVGVVFLVWICFIDTNNVGRLIRSRIELRNQHRQIELYKREISEMDRKLDQLRSERDSLEKFAREEYFYHQDGEDVFVIE